MGTNRENGLAKNSDALPASFLQLAKADLNTFCKFAFAKETAHFCKHALVGNFACNLLKIDFEIKVRTTVIQTKA